MKRNFIILLTGCLLAALLLAGCGDGAFGTSNNPNNVEDVLQERIDEAEGNTEKETETSKQSNVAFYTGDEEAETPDIYSTDGVDMDLTKMFGTMLYSQVNYMMYKPEKFIGQTVKVPGNFSAVYSEEDQRYYFGCLVQDQSACCVLGVEFELPEDYVYPDDYPAEGEEITVFGTFDTYQQGEYTYAVLKDAKMVS